MAMRVAINGFGRIGRYFLRRAMEYGNIEVVAINDLRVTPETAAYLFKYDSVYHKYKGNVSHHSDILVVDGKEIVITQEKNPQALPWIGLNINIVIESTGFFRDKEEAAKHLTAGAKKAIITAPSEGC